MAGKEWVGEEEEKVLVPQGRFNTKSQTLTHIMASAAKAKSPILSDYLLADSTA